MEFKGNKPFLQADCLCLRSRCPGDFSPLQKEACLDFNISGEKAGMLSSEANCMLHQIHEAFWNTESLIGGK